MRYLSSIRLYLSEAEEEETLEVPERRGVFSATGWDADRSRDFSLRRDSTRGEVSAEYPLFPVMRVTKLMPSRMERLNLIRVD